MLMIREQRRYVLEDVQRQIWDGWGTRHFDIADRTSVADSLDQPGAHRPWAWRHQAEAAPSFNSSVELE